VQTLDALRAHQSVYDPATQGYLGAVAQRFTTMTGDPVRAAVQAKAVLWHNVFLQAQTIAATRLFLTMGIVFVFTLPLLFRFKTGRLIPTSPGSAH
jgi:hypothetical protein